MQPILIGLNIAETMKFIDNCADVSFLEDLL
jgi:hypothetical protein